MINSKAAGESPRRFLRCSALASLDKPEVYSRICLSGSSSRGSSFDSCVCAQVDVAISLLACCTEIVVLHVKTEVLAVK